MSKNQIQHGGVLSLVAPSGGVLSGVPLIIGVLFCVPIHDADEDELFEGETRGVWEFAKVSADTPAQGAAAYFDVSEGLVTTTSTDNTLVGAFTEVRLNGDETAYVRLNGVTV